MEPWPLLIALAVLALFGMLFVLAGVGLYLMIRDTVRRRGGWGVNVERVACPCCAADLPRLRRPRSFRQAMWGGYTCADCGCEVDKWGREVERKP